MLSTDQLLSEAAQLTKFGSLLVPKGDGDPVGYWHGLTFDAPCITLRRSHEWISVEPEDSGSCIIRTTTTAPDSGQPLYAVPFMSLPPLDALFKLGSDAVGEYLSRNGWTRDTSFNSNFRDQAAHEYERHWQQNCPVYSKKAVAYTGGWNFPWPDDDFWDKAPLELVVCTLAESEPWIEVFQSNGRYQGLQRVT